MKKIYFVILSFFFLSLIQKMIGTDPITVTQSEPWFLSSTDTETDVREMQLSSDSESAGMMLNG